MSTVIAKEQPNQSLSNLMESDGTQHLNFNDYQDVNPQIEQVNSVNKANAKLTVQRNYLVEKYRTK